MGTPTTMHNVDDRGYVFVTEAADCQIVTAKTTVGTTAIPIPQDASGNPKNLPGRRKIYLKNNNASGGIVLYIGGADVSTTIGYPLPPQEELILDITDDIQLYAIAASGSSSDLRSLELA